MFLAAKHAFKPIGAPKLHEIANRLLNDGVQDDDLVSICLADDINADSITVAFEAFLRTCNTSIPDRDSAVWTILKYYVTQIADRSNDPLVATRNLIVDIFNEYDFQSQSIEHLGDSHRIQHLVGLYYAHDDMLERPQEVSCNGQFGADGIAELKKELVLAAQTWLTGLDSSNTG